MDATYLYVDRERRHTTDRPLREGADDVGNDEQLSMDLGVPVEKTGWNKWVDPKRHAGQVRKFLDRAGLPALPEEPWDFESHEACEINDMIRTILPDLESVSQPENADIVDQLVCFAGECFIQYLDARWIDLTNIPLGYNDSKSVSIYDGIKPGLAFEFEDWNAFTANLLVEFVVANEFIELYELPSVGFWKLRKGNEFGSTFSDLSSELAGRPPFM
ncbi:hypothetical protein [Nocardia sp. XZ_19_369]|uniref:hypothetical protein n=1 Tax=Nocardia sp. XZ_19_369 TaxID=2769487 RepID=UPI00188EE18B|nr:hypothetical protein [Nocardia sp. XZ_19_369]